MRKVCSVAFVVHVFLFSLISAAPPPVERLEGESISEDGTGLSEPNPYIGTDNLYAPRSDGDADLGEQVILQRGNQRAPVRLSANSFLFWSNNVASADTDEEDGWFYGGSLTARWRQRLTTQLFFDTYAYQDAYFYESAGLDFQSSEFGAGLWANLAALDDLAVYARYEFLYVHADNPLMGVLSPDEHIDNRYHRFRLGAFKALYSKPSHSVSLATNAHWDFDANSGTQRRQQVSGRLAYTWTATGNLRVTGFYRLSYRDYLASGREDWNQYLGLEFNYKLTDWAEAYGSVLYGMNDSNTAGRDYETVQAGLGLGLRASF